MSENHVSFRSRWRRSQGCQKTTRDSRSGSNTNYFDMMLQNEHFVSRIGAFDIFRAQLEPDIDTPTLVV